MKKDNRKCILVGSNSPMLVPFFSNRRRAKLTHFYILAAQNKRKVVPEKLKGISNIILNPDVVFDDVIIVLDVTELSGSVTNLITQVREIKMTSHTRVLFVCPKLDNINTVLNNQARLKDNQTLSFVISKVVNELHKKKIFSLTVINYINPVDRDSIFAPYLANLFARNDTDEPFLLTDVNQLVTQTYTELTRPYPTRYGKNSLLVDYINVITFELAKKRYKEVVEPSMNNLYFSRYTTSELAMYRVTYDWSSTRNTLNYFEKIIPY